MKYFPLMLFIFNSILFAQPGGEFMNGVDLSFIPQVEENGGTYYLDGTATDPFKIFSQNGINYVRLRIWHNPPDGYCNLEKTIEVALRAKQAGFKFLLDFHYSDTWADPGNQHKPAVWDSLDYEALLDSIYSYTYDVIKTLDTMNILPDMVQAGNEIASGFLWPTGRVGGQYDTPVQWTQFTNLLKSTIRAVHDAASDTVRIMIHIERGGDNNASRWFFDNLTNYGVSYDVIGLSYYPWWHGTLTALSKNLNDLALRYNKEVGIAETAYPWTTAWYDNTGNIVGSNDSLLSDYPPNEEGQSLFLHDLIQIVKQVPNGKGAGVFYWAPDWISTPTFGSAWENLALFDFQGNALTSIKSFIVNVSENEQINSSFKLYQNYPNPFNNSTIISYELQEKSKVNISVYNVLGEEVSVLLNGEKEKGDYYVKWYGKDDSGNDLTSGVYFIKLTTPLFLISVKAILLK